MVIKNITPKVHNLKKTYHFDFNDNFYKISYNYESKVLELSKYNKTFDFLFSFPLTQIKIDYPKDYKFDFIKSVYIDFEQQYLISTTNKNLYIYNSDGILLNKFLNKEINCDPSLLELNISEEIFQNKINQIEFLYKSSNLLDNFNTQSNEYRHPHSENDLFILQVLELEKDRILVSVFPKFFWKYKGAIQPPYYIFIVDRSNLNIIKDIAPFDLSIYDREYGGFSLLAIDKKNKRIIFRTLENFYQFDYNGNLVAKTHLKKNKLYKTFENWYIVGSNSEYVFFEDFSREKLIGVDLGDGSNQVKRMKNLTMLS